MLPAVGGSIDSAGPVIVDDWVLVTAAIVSMVKWQEMSYWHFL